MVNRKFTSLEALFESTQLIQILLFSESYLSWADFDTSKKKGVNRPFFTYFLLLTCTIVLIASIARNGWVVEPLEINPMIGPSAQTLIRMGAKDSYLIVNQNEAWRLLSSAVLHAGLVHYFINTLALWFVGNAIETSHGIVAAAILFVIPAIGGTILSAIFLPEYITVGASGGIFGLIGACLSDIMMNWKLLFCDFVTENGKKHRHVMVVVFLFLDIALNCIIGLTPYVDNFTRKSKLTLLILWHYFVHSLPSIRSRWDGNWSIVWVEHYGKITKRFFRNGRKLLVSSEADCCSVFGTNRECNQHNRHSGDFARGRR